MAPSGADISGHEMSSSSFVVDFSPATTTTTTTTTIRHMLQARLTLTTNEAVLMTHLVVWLLTFLSGLFFGLRVGAKCYRRAGLAVDDALLAAAWAAILFYSVIASLELALGLGNDDSSSSSSTSRPLSSSSSTTNTNEEALILLDHVARTFCLTAIAWSKSAVAVMLLKARGGSHSSLRPILQGLLFGFIAVVNTVLAAACLAHWFRCMPIAKEWDDSIDGSCWSMSVHGAIGIAAQSFSAAMDVTLVVIGLLLVWGPDLKVGDKAGVVALSMLGIVASAASITAAIEISTLTDSNFALANLRILLAASIETPIVILAASFPALRLFNKNYSMPPSSSSNNNKPYTSKHHKHLASSNSTTIRLIPTSDGQGGIPPPLTSTPALRGKTSLSSLGSGAGGPPPARPPRPASGEMGGFWADPSAPSALNNQAGGNVANNQRGSPIMNMRAQQARSPGDESSRGLLTTLLSPAGEGGGISPSPYTPGWGSSPSPGPHAPIQTSSTPAMISPYNHPHSHSNNNEPITDAFDTYHDVPYGLTAPRVLTPLEEEQDQYNSRPSSYLSSRVSESTMTNSHWLDIPVPPIRDSTASGEPGGNADGSERRLSSKFSVSGFIDSYGARAASVIRKMDLIVPMGGSGSGSVAQQQQQQQVSGLTKPGNRDSPTLGDYWGSLPSSPAVTTQVSTYPNQAPPGRGLPAGGASRYPLQPSHLRHPALGDINNNNSSSMSAYTTYNRF